MVAFESQQPYNLIYSVSQKKNPMDTLFLWLESDMVSVNIDVESSPT
jgi:hypothetical protein